MKQQDYATLSDYPIAKRWPAQHPVRLQLYSFPTPNGVKISIMLEELGVDYEVHRVRLTDEDVKSDAFLSLNPNNKIPAIIDPNGPDGKPLGLFESGAILLYLAEKYGKLLGNSAAERLKITQWLMFQVGGVGPMFGQLGYFCAFAGKEIEDPRPRERYINEAKRLLAVIDAALADQEWLVGEFSIADIAVAPWLQTLSKFYKVDDQVELHRFPHVQAYIARFDARDAVRRGWQIPSREG